MVFFLSPSAIVKRLAPWILSTCLLTSFNSSFDSKGLIEREVMPAFPIVIISLNCVSQLYFSILQRHFCLRAKFEKITILFGKSESLALDISFTYCFTLVLHVLIRKVFIQLLGSICI